MAHFGVKYVDYGTGRPHLALGSDHRSPKKAGNMRAKHPGL